MLAEECAAVGSGAGSPSSTTLTFGSTVLEYCITGQRNMFSCKKQNGERQSSPPSRCCAAGFLLLALTQSAPGFFSQ